MRVLLALLLPAVALGAVEQVTDQNTFKRILAENPAVVVDFFSQSCGPCIMIAPKYKELAKEYEGRVKFLKVDVQQHNVGVQIRSMPTFHFYLQGKLDHQFSGADENGMRQYTQQLDRKAEQMDIEVSLGALEAFYKEHDPSKLDNVDDIYEKYPAYKLVGILKKKYGKAPEYTKKNTRKQAPKPEGGAAAGGEKPVDIRKMDMDDLKAEVPRRPSTRRSLLSFARRAAARTHAAAALALAASEPPHPPPRTLHHAPCCPRRCTGARWLPTRRRRSSSGRRTTGGARSSASPPAAPRARRPPRPCAWPSWAAGRPA